MAVTAIDAAAPITTADGVPLKVSLARTERRKTITAFLLVSPLLAFILITFVFPIGDMLMRSVQNPVVADLLPRTLDALESWDPASGELPPEAAFEAAAEEFARRHEEKLIGKISGRINYDLSGAKSMIKKTARKLAKEWPSGESAREAFVNIDKRWGEVKTWAIVKQAGRDPTPAYYANALDRTYDVAGDVVPQPENRRIYVKLFVRTLWVSLAITAACLLLAYPVSYILSIVPTRISNLLIIMVLLPFWTSLLVRTTSWIVLLQSQGVINDLLVWIGVIGDEGRLSLVYNMTGTMIAMIQILLPFMILPLFSVMKTISPYHIRAAKSLGASPAKAFWTVYFPQTLPGIGAGSLLVFILSVGYYITPALVGGRTGQLISNMIAYHMQRSLNWGLAAALGAILLLGILALYWLYNRLVGIDKMKLG